MSVGITARVGPDRSSTHPRSEPVTRGGTRKALTVTLGVGAAMHLVVGVEHSSSNFGHLSLLAGVAQAGLAAIVIVRPSGSAHRVAAVLSLVLFQLYLLNVTVGLPPLFAHSHITGTHDLWGFTLAWPGPIDGEGALARIADVGAVMLAIRLDRRASRAPANFPGGRPRHADVGADRL